MCCVYEQSRIKCSAFDLVFHTDITYPLALQQKEEFFIEWIEKANTNIGQGVPGNNEENTCFLCDKVTFPLRNRQNGEETEAKREKKVVKLH